VLGDVRYESDAARHAAWPHARLALHARVLGFTHPVSGQSLRFESPLPREFEAFIQETAGS
jgi:23S rRNA pseudouridine1911/1915/1917 synthase